MGLDTWMRGRVGCPEPSMPAAFVLQLASAMQAAGGAPAQQLLAELGVTDELLTEPDRRVSLPDALSVVERAVELSSGAGLTLTLGLSASATRYGPVGLAAMCCATLGEAITTSIRYQALSTSAIRLHVRVQDERVVLEAEQVFPLGWASVVIIPALFIGLWRTGQTFTGHELRGDVDFSAPEPEGYLPEQAAFAPGAVRFGQPCDRMVFERAYLDLPLVSADPATARAMREQCERALSELTRAASLVSRVQQALFAADGGVRSARNLARDLGMSERTLKRRLAEQSTSYTELLDATRRARALELLGKNASVEEMSQSLGYSDAANFTRAFRRWTGQSPRAAREALRATRG